MVSATGTPVNRSLRAGGFASDGAHPALQSVTAKIAFFQDLSTEGVGRQSKTRFELTMKVTEVGAVKLTGVQACC